MTSSATAPGTPNAIDALNRFNEIVTRYCESQMFFAACELGVFEHLSHGPATAAELGAAVKAHPAALHSLLVGLAQSGLLTRDGDRFANAPIAVYATSSAATPLAPLAMWGSFFAPMWSHLADAVRENEPRWQQTFHASAQETFANLYQNDAALRRFCGLMSAYSIPQGKLVGKAYDFSAHQCILDVAGGAGGLIIEVGKRYPHIRGIVMDLPPVCAIADEAIRAAGLEGRFTSQFADLFEGPYPAGADVIALSWVLHDWNDEHCLQILRHCHAALPTGGALLINETVLAHDRGGTPFGVLMSLHMLCVCEPGARERTEDEYRQLLHAAGFHAEKLTRMDAPRDLLVARKT